MLLNSVFVQKLLGLLVVQNGVFWHHLVMGDVHLEIRELDDLDGDDFVFFAFLFL